MKKRKYLKPVTVRARREMRRIFNGIITHKLLYDQTKYVVDQDCGTAHCFAGWKVSFDWIEKGGETHNEKDFRTGKLGRWAKRSINLSPLASSISWEWDYAQKAWGLLDLESKMLFDPHIALDEIERTLDFFDKGYRLVYPSEIINGEGVQGQYVKDYGDPEEQDTYWIDPREIQIPNKTQCTITLSQIRLGE